MLAHTEDLARQTGRVVTGVAALLSLLAQLLRFLRYPEPEPSSNRSRAGLSLG